MAREFKILDTDKVDWLFLDKFSSYIGYVSYRHVIEHALFQLLKNNFSRNEIKKKFYSFKEDFDKGKDIRNEDNVYITIYFMKEPPGIALVDNTNWSFPLVCHIKSRENGLKKSIENIYDKIDPILLELEKNKNNEWNENIQEKMDQFDSRNLNNYSVNNRRIK